jgi:hypothetical protein
MRTAWARDPLKHLYSCSYSHAQDLDAATTRFGSEAGVISKAPVNGARYAPHCGVAAICIRK